MTLLAAFVAIVADWRSVFPQQRSWRRAVRQSLSSLVCLGRRCLSRILWTHGGHQRSWSAEYFLHSRCRWDPQALFVPVLRRALVYCPGRVVGVAVDDTRLRKTGRRIPQAFYQRDPLSPPFHVNLLLGLRFLQASLLVPLHRQSGVATRGLPIRFEEVSRVKKPSRKAPAEAWQEYKQLVRQYNLSQRFVQTMKPLRDMLDAAGGKHKLLVLAGDGSFANRTCLRAPRERTELIVRTRKDAVLCLRAPAGSRRFYAPEKFTPEQVRQDEAQPYKETKVFYGGKRRKVRYKEVALVYWRGGAGQTPLRLIVVAPTPYRRRKRGKLCYREPAYLLTTDLKPRPGSCCRSTSTVGRLKSITARRRTPSASGRPSCGTLPRYRNSRCYPWPPTVPCYWPPYKPSEPNAVPPMRPFRNGGARPPGRPASI